MHKTLLNALHVCNIRHFTYEPTQQNSLHTFPRNFPVVGKLRSCQLVTDLLLTS